VYGPGNKANFSLLLKMVKIGFPLPLGAIRNRRSFIYVENLVDLIMTCLGNPRAFGKTFIPSDMEDVSTPELVCKILQVHKIIEKGPADGALEKDRILKENICKNIVYTRIFPFPENILKILGCLPGLGALCKLTSSLYVDSEPVFQNLGWRPPFTLEEGLRRTLVKIE
jgi:nucleoside-diphosphate-sugar epimerase